MQDREFNNLMDGRPAKWADIENRSPERDQIDDQLNFSLIKGESKAEQRAKIKAIEKPIPHHISDAIHTYIKEERLKKVSERAIRRAVKRKWNIYVV
jgi:hypothetical protein